MVLCNPFGEEAIRAHRVYRIMARDLEQHGHPALRFDYRGTGDSAGASDEVSLESWLDDIAIAVAELMDKAKPKRLALIGLAFGGALAALAVTRRELSIHHLLLWDPVIRGDAYLRSLFDAHQSYMRSELPTWRDRRPTSADGDPTEALGTPIPDELRSAMAAVDLTKLDLPCDEITVVSTQRGPDVDALRKHLDRNAGRVTWLDVRPDTAWNSDEALNSAVIPKNVVDTLVSRVQAVSP